MSGRNPSDVYHYTDGKGIEGIKDSGVIASGSKDNPSHARFGDQVYWSDRVPADLTEHYVQAKTSDLPNVQRQVDGSGRSIYTSDNVNLDYVRHSTGRVNRK
ncbi:hypothetical protein CHUAL_011552 [Chamberlinius hualienensis]